MSLQTWIISFTPHTFIIRDSLHHTHRAASKGTERITELEKLNRKEREREREGVKKELTKKVNGTIE